MPNVSQHLSKAAHNENFALTFWPAFPQYADWAVTAYFYAAVHLVEACFATIGIHSANHQQRNREVALRLSTVAVHYMNLYRASRRARYDVTPLTPTQTHRLVTHHFQRFKAYVISLLP